MENPITLRGMAWRLEVPQATAALIASAKSHPSARQKLGGVHARPLLDRVCK
jgi:hypothetical protein